jgi:hypothetical protein
MSRDRFYQIGSNLYLYDPSEDYKAEENTLFKVESISDKIIVNSRTNYLPHQELSVDEGMINFNGRHKNKLCMPSMLVKYGFKVFMMADSIS